MSSAATCNHGERSATCPVCTLVIQTEKGEEFGLPPDETLHMDGCSLPGDHEGPCNA